MKQNKHPPYQEVLFIDSSNGHRFVCGSTLQPKETELFEGKTYPIVRLPITSASHPFFTGSNKFVDAEGRVEKFENRYKQAQQRHANLASQQEKQRLDALKTSGKKAGLKK